MRKISSGSLIVATASLLLFAAPCFARPAEKSTELKAADQQACKLVLVFKDIPPQYLFWETEPGTDACPAGFSCFGADGSAPPSTGTTEGDKFEGFCREALATSVAEEAQALEQLEIEEAIVDSLSSK